MNSSSSRSTLGFPVHWISTTCPATRPSVPIDFASSPTARRILDGEAPAVVERNSKAKERSASPASNATSSPKTLWLVGLPRRRSSLSIQGKSSWMSDMVWIISTAQAAAMASVCSPPTSSQAAIHSMGLTLFPPANNEVLDGNRLIERLIHGAGLFRHIRREIKAPIHTNPHTLFLLHQNRRDSKTGNGPSPEFQEPLGFHRITHKSAGEALVGRGGYPGPRINKIHRPHFLILGNSKRFQWRIGESEKAGKVEVTFSRLRNGHMGSVVVKEAGSNLVGLEEMVEWRLKKERGGYGRMSGG
nr:hypothetical protein Iba_scaffold9147CG0040 [Ipomoea batatas]